MSNVLGQFQHLLSVKETVSDDSQMSGITSRTRSATLFSELTAFFVLIFIVDWLLVSIDLFAFEPHPFWIPVLFFSLQYGSRQGMAAAVAATCVAWCFCWPERALTEPYFAYSVRAWSNPAMWLTGALMLGGLRQRQFSELTSLRVEVQRLQQQIGVFSRYCEHVKEANLDLQLQISAGQTAPVEHAVTQLGNLNPWDVAEFTQYVAETLELLVGARKSSVFIHYPNNTLRLAFQFGWQDGDRYRQVFQANAPLYQCVIVRHQTLSSRDEWAEQSLEGEGLVAIPISYVYGEGIFGMLKIEQAGEDIWSDAKLKSLRILAREVGIFLERHQDYNAGARQKSA
ncbi:MAG: GAF domain-containing protein [Methyloligellaceae bacterium]